MSHAIKTIGILGGGTAGYLCALALKKSYPKLSISLIESSEIPIIGVGEATTKPIVNFLHRDLGLDTQEFYQKVQPTFKLGIRFEWGLKKPDYYFNFPFEAIDACSAKVLTDDINNCSLYSILMSQNKSFILQHPKTGKYFLPHNSANYAYHLDNKLLATYLKEKILELGIQIHDATINHATKNNNGDIDALISDNGKKFSFDLYIDCSGFRSLLMKQTMKSSFFDYSNNLFTDSAMVFKANNYGAPNTYTQASTMPSGWMWNIPMRQEDHLGYVYSSSFCSDEQAIHDIHQYNPQWQNKEMKKITFVTGRQSHFCRNNVIAIGNAYGFVEPLESTGIHMIVYEIKSMIAALAGLQLTPDSIDQMNNAMNNKWDKLQWFLALHYKFNQKMDTDFWQACRSDIDISEFQGLLNLYHEKGPLKHPPQKIEDESLQEQWLQDNIFGAKGIDLMLIGQGILPKKLNTKNLQVAKPHFKQQVSLWQQYAKSALEHIDALTLIEQNPDILNT